MANLLLASAPSFQELHCFGQNGRRLGPPPGKKYAGFRVCLLKDSPNSTIPTAERRIVPRPGESLGRTICLIGLIHGRRIKGLQRVVPTQSASRKAPCLSKPEDLTRNRAQSSVSVGAENRNTDIAVGLMVQNNLTKEGCKSWTCHLHP